MASLEKTRPFIVRMEGLEPAYLSALDPKSSVSTNFTTSANLFQHFDKLSACSQVSFNLARFFRIGVQRYCFILNCEIMRKKYLGRKAFFCGKVFVSFLHFLSNSNYLCKKSLRTC